jgi:Sec-independent protein secretion pathway component TatC
MDHLRELRNRLLKAIIVIIQGMIVALVFSNQTLNIVARLFWSGVIDGMSGCHQVIDKFVINGVFDGSFLRIKIACA